MFVNVSLLKYELLRADSQCRYGLCRFYDCLDLFLLTSYITVGLLRKYVAIILIKLGTSCYFHCHVDDNKIYSGGGGGKWSLFELTHVNKKRDVLLTCWNSLSRNICPYQF